MRVCALAIVALLLCVSRTDAEPIKVRLAEGNTRGFLVVRPPGGEPIAHGELRQTPRGAAIESRLLLNFKDGSLYHETVTFSQSEVFRLEAYRLVQRGPSFPLAEISFDRKSGHYTARTQGKNEPAKTSSGALQMPADVHNGLGLVLLKNLPGGRGSGQMAVFTPAPRLIRMDLAAEGEDTVVVGGEVKTATRYLLTLEIGGLTGAIASLAGKDPPDARYWFVTGEVPAFARFEGALYLNGPVWRIELTAVEWPR
jgi:hypothetical protein